jgi:cytochrome d ubiquinol oxidase subunit I
MFATGDLQTREVQAYQPLKFAAMEGICKTQSGAGLSIIGIPPSQDCTSTGASLEIPYGLSLMSDFNPNGQIKGLDQQANQALWPPVAETFMSYHLMVGLGAAMMLLMLLGLFFLWRGSLEKRRWWLWLAVLAIPLPIIATELGWMTAEVGRQPWIVYGLMMTSAGTSPAVSSTDVSISIVAILLLYALLFFLWIYGVTREIRRGPELGAGAVAADPAAPTARSDPAAQSDAVDTTKGGR